MGNRAISETALLREGIAAFSRVLPGAWNISRADREPTLRGKRFGAVFVVRAPDGDEARIAVGASTSVEARDIARIAYQLREGETGANAPALLIAPFLSSRARELLERASVSYIDLTGNSDVRLDRPGLLLRTSGANSNPERGAPKMLRSLRGRGAGRAMRALVDFRPPYGMRELAARSRTPVPTISRVADLLARDALLRRDGPRGPVAAIDWDGALRRWAQDYGFAQANRTESCIAPRGLRAWLSSLTSTNVRYAISGPIAANRLRAITEPRLAVVFVDDAVAARELLALRPAETGANVILAEPYDSVVFERTESDAGLVYVSPSQVVVDSLTGAGRAPAEGEAVLSWMADNEGLWRV